MIRFQENTAQFMDEFVRRHTEFEQLIDQGRFAEVNPRLLSMIDAVLPGFAFRLIRTESGKKIHLELTTTLDPLKRILAFYFLFTPAGNAAVPLVFRFLPPRL